MLSRTIADSKKLSVLDERSALIYLLLLPHHDGEGLLECDDVSMLVACGRYALTHSWSSSAMAETRRALVESGLWKISEGPHGEVAEFVGWGNHQRLDKIGRGSELWQNSGETMAELRHNSSAQGKGREGKGNTEEEGKGSTSDSAPDLILDGKPTTAASEKSRVLRSWNLIHEAEGAAITVGIRDHEAVEEAVRLGVAFRWKTDEQLAAEMLRVRNGLRARRDKSGKAYGSGLAAVLRNLGGEFGADGNGKAPAVVPPDEESVEAMKRRTRDLIDSVASHLPKVAP